jgi:hypothetical protein
LPEDTAKLPYEVRIRGILVSPAAPGESASVVTATGRQIAGELETVEPADTHTFGRPVHALVETIGEIENLRRGLE